MNKKVKAKTFTLVAINHIKNGPVYAFSDSRRVALCYSFVKSYLGKTPRKIKVRVRTTMAVGYTKAGRESRCLWVRIGKHWMTLFSGAIAALDSVFGTKTFYFKITEVK